MGGHARAALAALAALAAGTALADRTTRADLGGVWGRGERLGRRVSVG